MVAIGLAWAADTMGPAPLPLMDQAQSPVRVSSTRVVPRFGWSVVGGLRIAGPSLTEFSTDGTDIKSRQLVGTAVDGVIGGTYSPLHRVSVSAAVPFRIAAGGEEAGGGIGDVRLSAGLGLLGHAKDDGPRVRITPWLRLPTGGHAKNLGTRGVRLGALVSGSYALGPMTPTLEYGQEWLPDGDLPGGVGWRVGGALNMALGPRVLVGIESTSWGLVDGQGRGVGSETGLSVGMRLGRGWVSASPVAGLWGREPGSALQSISVVGGYASPLTSESGPLDPMVSVRVVDPSGKPVRGAQIRVGEELLGSTGVRGEVSIDREIWRNGMEVSAPGLVPTALDRSPSGTVEVEMPYALTPVRVRIANPVGEAVPAMVLLQDLEGGEIALQPEGLYADSELPPGRWMLRVEAEGYGAQERLISVQPRRRRPLYVEVILLEAQGTGTLALTVQDADGHEVEGAPVQLDGLPVGTTGSAGALWVHGLQGKSRAVTIRSVDYAEKAVDVAVSASEDVEPTEVTVDYLPGTLQIRALGPSGPIPDGLVMISGPTTLPPMELGADGERLVVLDLGTWTVVLSSAALGIQERTVEVKLDSPNPLAAIFDLQEETHGNVDLRIVVRDSSGAPLDEAEVLVDGQRIGVTSSGGSVRLRDLREGSHALNVTHTAIHPVSEALWATDGLEEHLVMVRWKEGVARVTATAGGLPADALVLLEGSTTVGPLPLGSRGQRYFDSLVPGTWAVTASSAEHGVQSRTLTIATPADGLPEALIRYGGDEGGPAALSVLVTDAEGRAVVGAPVALDGLPAGRTGSDGIVRIERLNTGKRRIRACDSPRVEATAQIVLKSGHQRLPVRCDWGVGATRLSATYGGEPADNTMVLLSGATPREPRSLDREGQVLLTLDPGPWTATLSHPKAGIVELPIVVGEGRGLQEVQVDLDEPDAPTLLVEVRGTDGFPVQGAKIRVGGVEKALTGPSGYAAVRGLEPGEVLLEVVADGFETTSRRVRTTGVARRKVVELEPILRTLHVRVVDSDGHPVNGAEIDVVGRRRLPSRVLADGAGEIEVTAGRWSVFARAEGLAATRAEVEVVGPESEVTLTLGSARVVRVGAELRIEEIRFKPGKSEVDPSYRPLLEELASWMLAAPDIARVEAQGHTDSQGAIANNMELSQIRAEAVRSVLVDLGVSQSRIVARGFGPTHPVEDNGTDAGRRKNRRVAFVVVANAPLDDMALTGITPTE